MAHRSPVRTLVQLLLTLSVGAVPVALTGAPASADTITGLQTPSGNIQCMYYKDAKNESLRCTVLNSTAVFEKKPADCEFDWGADVGMDAKGKASRLCVSDTVAGKYPVVAYGTQWKKGAFSCTSATSGLTCRNSSRHGFTIAKAKQTIF